jgi:xylulokinase
MGVLLSAASCLAWWAGVTGRHEPELLAEIGSDPAPSPAWFAPYLSGERTPHNDPHARGVFFGLDHGHDAAALGYAVIEGVAFGLRDGWASLGAPAGGVASLSLVGGGARSALWADLLASALGVPLVTRAGGETGGALGAARLAWLAAGGDEAAVCTALPVVTEHLPRAEASQVLAARHARFTDLYVRLRGAVAF